MRTGRLAAGLGLIGAVEADRLRALIEQHHYRGGEPLAAPKQPTLRAIDTAPKSVSLL